MMGPDSESSATTSANGESGDLRRMQLELALGMAGASADSLAEKIAKAAEVAGADLLFMLPTPNGQGMSGMLRINGAAERFVQIRTEGTEMEILEGDDVDPYLLRLARASVEVLQRLGADRESVVSKEPPQHQPADAVPELSR